MATHVNLDALIPREDFEVISSGDEAPAKVSIQISDLERTAFFYIALRKPDFQRETAEWDPARVAGLVSTFITEGLIPGVILWKNKDLLFVIDGSHRLSALIAWVHDDYGDGASSQEFFGHDIPDEQKRIGKRTRDLLEKDFGSYQSHKDAIANPHKYGPDVIARARRFGSLSLSLQWVRGDAGTAENSFVRINQQAAIITPQELELIQSRRKPNAIAARAVVRRGTGHQYWSQFPPTEQDAIRDLAIEIHTMMFSPTLVYPIRSLDLPAGGPVYSSTTLRMVYDFIERCVGVSSPENDTTGKRTVEYLKRAKRVMQLILSNHASSLGLHPAIYFYSWTGKQQPILFQVISSLAIHLERTDALPLFIECRAKFEEFLITNRSLLNQVIRKFGTKNSGHEHLTRFYDKVLAAIAENCPLEEIIERLRSDASYSYLQPGEVPYDSTSTARYSRQARSGLIFRELLPSAPRCAICGGLVPSQAISLDHIQRLEDGGLSVPDNAQVTHPYCNTGYKEKKAHAARTRI